MRSTVVRADTPSRSLSTTASASARRSSMVSTSALMWRRMVRWSLRSRRKSLSSASSSQETTGWKSTRAMRRIAVSNTVTSNPVTVSSSLSSCRMTVR